MSLQEFDGSFELSAQLLAIAGVAIDVVQTIAAELGVSETVVATALAILVFEDKLAQLQDDWKLIVNKVWNSDSIALLLPKPLIMNFSHHCILTY